jgi:hypothetical protein
MTLTVLIQWIKSHRNPVAFFALKRGLVRRDRIKESIDNRFKLTNNKIK